MSAWVERQEDGMLSSCACNLYLALVILPNLTEFLASFLMTSSRFSNSQNPLQCGFPGLLCSVVYLV